MLSSPLPCSFLCNLLSKGQRSNPCDERRHPVDYWVRMYPNEARSRGLTTPFLDASLDLSLTLRSWHRSSLDTPLALSSSPILEKGTSFTVHISRFTYHWTGRCHSKSDTPTWYTSCATSCSTLPTSSWRVVRAQEVVEGQLLGRK